jgi:translation initiation factor eIF-2B subunit epsilon
LAQGVTVYQSTLGADCALGPNTSVRESYIFDDVRIGANCSLNNCIVGRNVQIGDNVKIGKGVLLGDGVKLGKGITVPEFARVGRERYVPDYADEEDEIEGEEEKGEQPRRRTRTIKLILQLAALRSWERSRSDTFGRLRRRRSKTPTAKMKATTRTSIRATSSSRNLVGPWRIWTRTMTPGLVRPFRPHRR